MLQEENEIPQAMLRSGQELEKKRELYLDFD